METNHKAKKLSWNHTVLDSTSN